MLWLALTPFHRHGSLLPSPRKGDERGNNAYATVVHGKGRLGLPIDEGVKWRRCARARGYHGPLGKSPKLDNYDNVRHVL